MVLSLGLDKMIAKKIKNKEKNFLPKILDYACGAGHFLTESIDELQNHIKNLDENEITDKDIKKSLKKYQNNTEWAKEYIFGIEKDYRLARTSQIACFLNGDGDANIIYGDGLVEHTRLNTRRKPFDTVIANPPYAIKSFKNYLQIKPDDYAVYKCLTENSQEIETLFVERTKQVLKEKGKAAIILPSSILSNNSKPYQTAREILLENFEIKAISEFGSGTFGATGTSTVILFLQKRSADFQKDRKYISEDLFNGVKRKRKLEHIDSAMLLQKYISYREVDLEDYQSLLKKEANEKIKQTDFWQEYQDWFDNLSEIKNLKEQNQFLKLIEQEKDQKLELLFYQKILKKEQEKFYFFMLSLGDNHRAQTTILVKTGEKNPAKAFIGYEFSKRKGSAGIKIFRDSQGNPTTKLYDDNNHNNPGKASSYILKNFWNEEITEINKNIAEHISIANLTEMLDFSLVEFSKAISLNPQNNIHIETNYELVKLGEVAKIEKGRSITQSQTKKGNIKVVAGGIDYAYLHNESNRAEKTITISASGANAGYVNFWNEPIFASDCTTIIGSKDLITYYVFCVLKFIQDDIFSLSRGAAQPHVYPTDIENIKIPLPPLEVQQKIVDECEAVDNEVEQSRQTITEAKQQVEQKVRTVMNAGYEMKKIGEIAEKLIAGGDVPENNFSTIKTDKFSVPIFANAIKDKGLYGYTSIAKIKKPSITISARGTIGHTEVRNEDFYPIVRLIVLIPNIDLVNIFYLNHIVSRIDFTDSGSVIPQLTVPAVSKIKIPVPPLEIQKKLVAEVEELEKTISKTQEILDNSATQKNTILKKHL